MPDTTRNQRAFPQSRAQGIGLGFPLVRMVAIISLATGVARDLALGPYRGKETGEPALFRALMDGLAAGEIAVGDRIFASYFGIAGLVQRGVDGVFRMHQARKVDFRRGRCVGLEDHVVSWVKPERPEWMDEATYAQSAGEMPVRELRFRVEQRGYRAHEIVLVTTLLDAERYTKEELADLFLKRWNVELDLRSIKDVMKMDVLRGQSPEIVEKEIWMHLLAYNLIRGVIGVAAQSHGKAPRQVSFKGALQTMTAFQDVLRQAPHAARQRLFAVMLKAIAGHRVGNRPGRVEPRVNKRRPKKQRYLTEPRKVARKRLLDNVL
jgi:Transposase DDE domain